MKELINFIPGRNKDVAFPERFLAKTETDFLKIANKFNGIRQRLYYSIYDCDENRNFENAQIHVIAFDLDSKNALNNLIKIWEYCKVKNYKSLYIFSTKGFWVYIFTNKDLLLNPRGALQHSTHHLAEEIGFNIDNTKDSDLDPHIIGDIKRIARFPNGYDIKRQRYCIPITIEDMQKGYEWICQKSKKQCFDFVYYNTGLFDLKPFDMKPKKMIEVPNLVFDIKVDDKIVDQFFSCMKDNIVNTPLKSNIQYWIWITIYLKELGFPVLVIKKILKPYLETHPRTDGKGKNDWIHYTNWDHLPESIFGSSYSVPGCNELINSGFCQAKCKKYSGDKFPMYR